MQAVISYSGLFQNFKTRGNSLIEVLVGLTIFAITILGGGMVCLKGFLLSEQALHYAQGVIYLESLAHLLSADGAHYFMPNELTQWNDEIARSLPSGELEVSWEKNWQISLKWRKKDLEDNFDSLKLFKQDEQITLL